MPRLDIQEDGVRKSEKRTLNFVEGDNITITITDDVENNQADIQIDAAAGGPGSGAPTDADYLVGTAHADLDSEIVVGTTPGGELGGTWASPTVDATHSGSSHAATQAAAEATAAAALTAHEGAGDPHTGYRLESADHTHQSTGAQAGTLDHGLALTGLSDNDHPQYILHSLADAAGDLLVASAADAFARLGIGADGTVLSSNGTTASWQVPGAASHPTFATHTKHGTD